MKEEGGSALQPGRVLRLARKELSEILRDRRTILTLVAMPLLLYPVLSVAFQQFFLLRQINPDQVEEYRLGFPTKNEADAFLHRIEQGKTARPKSAKEPRLKVYLGTSEELTQALRDGNIDLALHFPKLTEWFDAQHDAALDGTVQYLANAPAALGALAYLDQCLAAANTASLTERLNLPGTQAPALVLRLARTPLRVEGGDSGLSLASLVPLILILMTITGAVYPAIDLTAGERERGTLEILIAAPVPRVELLTAKYLTVVTVAVLTALVNLVGMTITLTMTGLGRAVFGEAGLSPLMLLELFALLLLFAAFFAAVLLAITSFARSFKEAQAYLIPLMLASLAPGVMGMMPGLKLTGVLTVVPLLNLVLLARDLLGGNAEPATAGLVALTTALYAVAALSLAARVFGAESVLYSEQSSWSDLWRRPDAPQPTASLPTALWCLALLVPLSFALHWPLQSLSPEAVTLQLSAVAAISIVLFVGIPALATWLGRVQPASGFGLAPARPTALLGGLLLGGSLWPFVLRFLAGQEMTDALRDQLGPAVQKLREAQFGMLTAVIVSAVCEELFFRGFLFQALRRQAGAVVTIGVSAILFGLTHVILGGALGLERLLPSTLLGLVLGTVCWATGSVWPGIVLHVCHNAILVLVGQSELGQQSTLPWEWLAGGAAGIMVGIGLLWCAGRRTTAQGPLETS